MKRQMVVVDVPVEGFDAATEWNWQELIDTPHDVMVLGAGPIYDDGKTND